MIAHCLEAIDRSRSIDAVVVVAPASVTAQADAAHPIEAWLSGRCPLLAVVAGGDTRQESTRLGLDAVPSEASVVVCHDAARPFARPELFDLVVETLESSGGRAAGVIPVVPVPDTVKRVEDGVVVETMDRSGLALAQTPQAFDAAALRHAHERARAAGREATDDAMLLEWAGLAVAVVPGHPSNHKITTPDDLRWADSKGTLPSEADPAVG